MIIIVALVLMYICIFTLAGTCQSRLNGVLEEVGIFYESYHFGASELVSLCTRLPKSEISGISYNLARSGSFGDSYFWLAVRVTSCYAYSWPGTRRFLCKTLHIKNLNKTAAP